MACVRLPILLACLSLGSPIAAAQESSGRSAAERPRAASRPVAVELRALPALPPSPPAPRSPAAMASRPAASLAELEQLALQNNPTIQAAQALVKQQEGLLRQVTRYPNPTVGWLQSTPSPTLQGPSQGAFISQDIVTAGKLRLAGQAEKAEIEWRLWQVRAQVGRVLNDVRTRYFEVLGAQNSMTTAAELERLAESDLQAVKQLVEAKQASRPDLIQAEIHLNAVRGAREDARLRHEAAWRQLRSVVGVATLAPAELTQDFEADIPRFEWDQTLERLLAESPVLRAQAAMVREAEIELKLQKRLVMPNINVQTVIQHTYVKDFNQVSTLVSAPLPLFNRNRGNIINAEATLSQQQAEYRRLQLALTDQLATSFQQYASARNQVERLREILPRTQENIELTTQAYKTGQTGFDFLRVRDAEQTYYQTRTSYIDSLTALRKVAIEIEDLELTGGLNPTEIGTALQATPGVPAGLGGVLLQLQQQQGSAVIRTLPGAIQGTISGGP